MGFKFKPWMKIGRHYTPRRGDPGYEEYAAGDYRASKRAALGQRPHPKPVAAPEPEPEPEPVEEPGVVEKAAEATAEVAATAVGATAAVAEAAVKAPVKVAGAAAGAAVDGTKAAAGAAAAGAGMALSGAEAVVTAPLKAAKALTKPLRRRPVRGPGGKFIKGDDEVPDTPEESLAPEPKAKSGGFISGLECQFCGKTYRLERYFLPHVQKCPLNPSNIRG